MGIFRTIYLAGKGAFKKGTPDIIRHRHAGRIILLIAGTFYLPINFTNASPGKWALLKISFKGEELVRMAAWGVCYKIPSTKGVVQSAKNAVNAVVQTTENTVNEVTGQATDKLNDVTKQFGGPTIGNAPQINIKKPFKRGPMSAFLEEKCTTSGPMGWTLPDEFFEAGKTLGVNIPQNAINGFTRSFALYFWAAVVLGVAGLLTYPVLSQYFSYYQTRRRLTYFLVIAAWIFAFVPTLLIAALLGQAKSIGLTVEANFVAALAVGAGLFWNFWGAWRIITGFSSTHVCLTGDEPRPQEPESNDSHYPQDDK